MVERMNDINNIIKFKRINSIESSSSSSSNSFPLQSPSSSSSFSSSSSTFFSVPQDNILYSKDVNNNDNIISISSLKFKNTLCFYCNIEAKSAEIGFGRVFWWYCLLFFFNFIFIFFNKYAFSPKCPRGYCYDENNNLKEGFSLEKYDNICCKYCNIQIERSKSYSVFFLLFLLIISIGSY
jgi:hypothetical protein